MKASHFGINPRMFSRNAITVVEKLQRQGYEAYIVGGCLRDLLLGKHPKDLMWQQMHVPTKFKRYSNVNAV